VQLVNEPFEDYMISRFSQKMSPKNFLKFISADEEARKKLGNALERVH